MGALPGKDNHNYKHGGEKKWPKEYKSWMHMKSRCYCKTNAKYTSYGGRGIKVCNSWIDNFAQFLADMGPRPKQATSIERINNDGDYVPDNCKWGNAREQANNRRSSRHLTYNGKTKTAANWSKELGMTSHVLLARIDTYGMTIKEAIETPVKSPVRSKITFNGETKSISQWSRDLGFGKNTISERLRKGWSVKEALTTPKMERWQVRGKS